MRDTDRRFMQLAIALGRRGLGRVWPNPAVGCVVVHDGRIVGRGWTAPGGRPHAEPQALRQAGHRARGATAYVSLEPCAHHGRTPPCADALISAGVVRVVTATTDPDPRVAGAGHARLRHAGIEVIENVCEAEARAANAGFLLRVTAGRPWLTLKLALTLDGRIATAMGESRWITGPESRRAVHAMRACHDGVLVGAGTARADDPDLRVRALGPLTQPVRIVAAPRLRVPVSSRLGKSAGQTPVWMLHAPEAPAGAQHDWQCSGATLIEVAPSPDVHALDPAAMLAALGARGMTRVLCEGGGMLAASLLRAGLVDELAVFSAGAALGGDARPGIGALGVTALAEAPRFDLVDARAIGADVLTRWRPPPQARYSRGA